MGLSCPITASLAYGSPLREFVVYFDPYAHTVPHFVAYWDLIKLFRAFRKLIWFALLDFHTFYANV